MTKGPLAEDADYEGVRSKLRGHLGTNRIAMQIDIGFSDVITPGPVRISYPTILDQPAAELQAYNRETVVAEKFEAMVKLGELNSRMKDFFDIWLLARDFEFDGRVITEAIRRTFERRGTPLEANPICFKDDFAAAPSKVAQWLAFVRRGRLADAPAGFPEVVGHARVFLQPPAAALTERGEFDWRWPPGGPWQPRP